MRTLTGPIAVHPCFNAKAHGRFGRIHLPVAPRCNIQCAFCDRRYSCPNESRPGVTAALLTPEEAAERTALTLTEDPRIQVAGIAGPGEALANPETFETLRLLRRRFPNLTLCMSTNGLLLPECLPELLDCGLNTLTVTMSAATIETARRIYIRVGPPHAPLPQDEGIPLLLEHQREGVKAAAKAGLTVKVNTVLIPGINDAEIPQIAALSANAGAALMNIMPLIPCGLFSDRPRPSAQQLGRARQAAGLYLPQFTLCKQCRADACGIPGLESSPTHLSTAVACRPLKISKACPSFCTNDIPSV